MRLCSKLDKKSKEKYVSRQNKFLFPFPSRFSLKYEFARRFVVYSRKVIHCKPIKFPKKIVISIIIVVLMFHIHVTQRKH